MLLIPRLLPNNLELDGFSYRTDELETVNRVLNAHNLPFSQIELPSDHAKRTGRRWTLDSFQTAKFERALDVILLGMGDQTVAHLGPGAGSRYCCMEIRIIGGGKGLEPLQADNDDEALVKCSLVANRKHWFGGVVHQGECP